KSDERMPQASSTFRSIFHLPAATWRAKGVAGLSLMLCSRTDAIILMGRPPFYRCLVRARRRNAGMLREGFRTLPGQIHEAIAFQLLRHRALRPARSAGTVSK